ncbi:hypothetical protein [Kitasatospora camelliae]|uniref:Uncharacterized protein n=1 Tax=Kitasatospora camelliae TaxID=3156397 RepID=A0AAU8JNH0_9ACTN
MLDPPTLEAVQEWGPAAEGHIERRDTVITWALPAGPELTEDPWGAEPVRRWRDVRDRQPGAGTWPVTADRDRPQWDCTPLEGVGPLRFGMSPLQVAAALDGEVPDARRGRFPWRPWTGEVGVWALEEERFDRLGVSAHYGSSRVLPALAAVTVHGRTGPRVTLDGFPLIGRPVTAVEAALTRDAEDRGLGLRIGCGGDLGLAESNLFVRSTRAGDAAITEARFCAPQWEDHG